MRAVYLSRAPRVRQCLDPDGGGDVGGLRRDEPIPVSVEAVVTDALRSGAIVTVDVVVDTGSTPRCLRSHETPH